MVNNEWLTVFNEVVYGKGDDIMANNVQTSEVFFKHDERGSTIVDRPPSSITDKIRRWSIERNLHEADPIKQALKLGEEVGEIFEGLAKSDEALIKDGIGDVYVVLTILSQQLGFTVEECIEIAYGEIKDRRGVMKDGVFIKEEDLDGTWLPGGGLVEVDCESCRGSGFGKPGTGYDSICDECGGRGVFPK